MTKIVFLKFLAAAGLAFSGPALSQATPPDPNDSGEYEPAAAHAAALERRVDQAEREGAIRAGFGGALVVLVGGVALWRGRRSPSDRTTT